jgi:hypothetical protein
MTKTSYNLVRNIGEVPEWLNGAVSKTVVALTGHRGFESLPLRSYETPKSQRLRNFVLCLVVRFIK